MAIHICEYTAFWLVPVERLDVQMLLDPFEETFHLPTFPIKFSNGQVGMCEVIGQEPIDISRG